MFKDKDNLFGQKEKPTQFQLREQIAEIGLMNGVHIVLRFREELDKNSFGDNIVNSQNFFWEKKNQQFNDYVQALTTSDQVYMLNTDHVSSVKLINSSERTVKLVELESK
jgi:hypothetical protein